MALAFGAVALVALLAWLFVRAVRRDAHRDL